MRGSGGCARLQPAAWYLCEGVAQPLTTGRLESALAATAAPCAGGVGVRVGESCVAGCVWCGVVCAAGAAEPQARGAHGGHNTASGVRALATRVCVCAGAGACAGKTCGDGEL